MLFERNVRHLSLRYIVARLREIAYQRRSKNLPWLTEEANNFLENYLLASDTGLEFGSGRSTLWFAKRVKHMVSLEHDCSWHKTVLEKLSQERLTNVDYRYLDADENDWLQMTEAIKKITSEFHAECFDFVLVDGVCRDSCTKESIRLLRPGGVLIIDNVNRHLPSKSFSPNSRSYEMGPDGFIWTDVLNAIKYWRHYWTSSGVTDTAIYFKPEHVIVNRDGMSE